MSADPPFHGIYPILYAFFGPDGSLDRAAMRRQVEACIAAGAHGIAVLGLATEVNKLSTPERRLVMEWAAEDIAGRVPLAVTVAEGSVDGQVAFAEAAAQAGAAWVILQPPRVGAMPEEEYIRFFGKVADRATLPVAIQNAPDYLGVGLSPDGLETLNRNHPNVTLLKGEGSAVAIRELIERTDGRLAVFNGRGGLEITDCLRAGCAGMIPAPDCFDVQVKIYELMATGKDSDAADAERLYRDILPLITFVMQSIEHLLCYGKRVAARRLGIAEVHVRTPSLRPTEFGLACAERHAAALGPLGG